MKRHYLIPLVVLLMTSRAYCQDVLPDRPRVEVGVGLGDYGIVPNGTWYQIGSPRDVVNTRTKPWSLGVVQTLVDNDRFGIDARAAYVNLGHASSSCYCTSIDADYNARAHTIRAGSPMAQYNGHGDAQGIKLSLTPYMHIGDWRIGVEAGLFWFRPAWRESVYGWTRGSVGPLNFAADASARPVLSHMTGINVSHGPWSLSYVRYKLPITPNDSSWPPLYTREQLVMVTYAF